MGGLGDSLLIYPVLEILTKNGYEVTVWGNPEYFKMAELANFCKKAYFYEPKGSFDKIIIFSKNRELIKDKMAVYVNPLPDKKIWIVKYYLEVLGFEDEEFSLTLKLPLSIKKADNLCIIHPSSGSKKKNPAPHFFIKLENLIRSAGFNVLFLLGPAEKELEKIFKNSFYIEDPVEIAKLLLKASLYIGLDSGVSHMSSYLGVPSIVIYGPTDPDIWHPVGKNLVIIRDEECPPCYPSVCNHKKCLNYEILSEKISKSLKFLRLR